MSVYTTPPPPPTGAVVPPKKRGLGCLGCGCAVLALLIVLFFAAVAGLGYVGYNKFVGLTSTTPTTLPPVPDNDQLYVTARQKVADFSHDVQNHQAATIRLSGDELNALIARNPDAVRNHVHVFVTLANDEARMQISTPTDTLSHGLLTGRYANIDTTFGVHFDPGTKSVELSFRALQFGGKVLMGANADETNSSGASFNQSFMRSFTPGINQSLNSAIRKDQGGRTFLDQAKTVEIKDGELVLETQ